MRKLFHLLSLMVLGLSVHSCAEYDEQPLTEAPVTPILYDVRWLEETKCFTMDDIDVGLFKSVRNHAAGWWERPEYYDSVFAAPERQPLSYENLTIMFYQAAQGGSLNDCTPLPLRKDIDRVAQAATMNMNAQDKFIRSSLVGKEWAFAAARINGKASITADRTLYGQPAGSNLSEHFTVEGRSQGVPKGEFTNFLVLNFENTPSKMDEYLAQGTWLQLLYALRMADIPEERYDEVNFTVSLPVEYELWWKSQPKVETEPHVLSAQCTAHFGKISDFKNEYREFVTGKRYLFYW